MKIKFLSMVLLSTCVAVSAAEWPQWRGPNRDGIAPQSPPLTATWNKDGPVKLWESAEIPCGPAGGYSSLSIAGGRVYTYYYATTPTCTDGFCCVNAADGKTVWKKEFPGLEHGYHGNSLPSSTPCVAGGKLYCVGGAGDAYCLDAATGAEVWKAKADSGKMASGLMTEVDYSSFLVSGALAVLQTGDGLTAFDAAKGAVVWRQEKVKCRESSVVEWTKDAQSCFVCNTSTTVFCLESKTGNVLWSIPAGEMSTPLILGDRMVIVSQFATNAYRLALAKPEKALWTVPFGARGCSPALVDGHIYCVTPTDAICINLESGKVAWEEHKLAKDGYIFGSATAADGKIFANMNDARLIAVKATPEKFEILEQANIGIIACTIPVIADGKLYVRALSNHVVCFDLRASAVAAKH